MGLDNVGNSNLPAQQEQYYDDGGGYAAPYDPWMGKPTSNMNERIVMEILYTGLPDDETQFNDFIAMFRAEIERLIRTPNLTMLTIREIRRDTEDILDISYSEGMEDVAKSMMLKHLKYVSSLSACGDHPLNGLTSIGAIITNKQISEQTVKMPQQPAPVGFLSSLNPFRRK